MRQPTVRSRVAWTLVALALAVYWSAVVAFGPLVSNSLGLWDQTAGGIGLLVAYTAGQLATCGYRPGRTAGGTRIV